jgi:hypothetical protein
LTNPGAGFILYAVKGGEMMEKVQKREGLVCICAECKKVIGSIGSIDASEVPLISHGICPACAEKLYGALFRDTTG